MIEKLELPKIPYVDGMPDENQERITWIQNGESLNGAKTKTDNSGNLNKSGTIIQKNVVCLETNQFNQLDKVNELVDNVNTIHSNLPAIGNGNIFEQVQLVLDEIEQVSTELAGVVVTADKTKTDLSVLTSEIGLHDPILDPRHRTVRNDIIFLKNELGSYIGFDVNGGIDPTSQGTGLKYRVIQNALATANQEGRITRLEDNWILSDVGQITDEVRNLRIELGSVGQATQESVYTRISAIKTLLDSVKTQSDQLVTYTGYTVLEPTIPVKIAALSDRIQVLENIITNNNGIVTRLDAITEEIGDPTIQGSIRNDIEDIKLTQTDFEILIGQNSSEGVRGELANINADIGNDALPNSVKGRVSALEVSSRENALIVTGLTQTVGNASTGLVAASVALGKSVYGDSAASTQFEQDGLVNALTKVIAEIGNSSTGNETGIYQLIAALAARVSVLEQ